jgi:hypothetical protein
MAANPKTDPHPSRTPIRLLLPADQVEKLAEAA